MKTHVLDVLDRLSTALAGRSSLQREVGRGGMATVYLAQDLRHDRPIAVKGLHPEVAATFGPERFQREIRVAARALEDVARLKAAGYSATRLDDLQRLHSGRPGTTHTEENGI